MNTFEIGEQVKVKNMKRIFSVCTLVLSLLSVQACGVISPAPVPYLTPTALWQTPQAIVTPGASQTATPIPAATATPAALINEFNPYDGSIAPSLGVYEVAPLYGTYLATYTYKNKPNNYYPAFFFALQNTSKAGFTLDFDYCGDNLVDPLIAKLNSPKAYAYLNAYTDGVNFSDGFRSAIAPLNTVNVIQVSFKKPTGAQAQWYAKIQTIPCANASKIDPTTLQPYMLQYQSDQSYNGALEAGIDLMGFAAIMPLVSSHDVWIPFSQLEVTTLPTYFEVENTGGYNLNLRSGPSTSNAIIDKMPEYSHVTSTGVSLETDSSGITWIQVTDSNHLTGWCSTAYLVNK